MPAHGVRHTAVSLYFKKRHFCLKKMELKTDGVHGVPHTVRQHPQGKHSIDPPKHAEDHPEESKKKNESNKKCGLNRKCAKMENKKKRAVPQEKGAEMHTRIAWKPLLQQRGKHGNDCTG